MEATRETVIERLEIRRRRGLRYRLVVDRPGLARFVVELPGAPALDPARLRGPLARLALDEHLRPAFQLTHHGGDAQEEPLLVAERSAVAGLERRQLAPERLALQLELGDLVAKRIELLEQALEALAERGRSEDDGSGSDAGHGLGARTLPDFVPLPDALRPRAGGVRDQRSRGSGCPFFSFGSTFFGAGG